MIRALLDRLQGRRWVFVVGKGGVGKTTAAAALALAYADAGEATHLISVDPAHSLADVFGVAPLPSLRTSPCAERLTLEELDADAFGAAWRRDNAPALGELIERGTYLDTEDVEGFLRLSLPGVDEIMAALRLAELDEGPFARIVVDTAPTGHALRLFDAGATLMGWSSAFEAMRAKGNAVAGALTGREASAAGTAALRRLTRQVERFESRVLGSAAFLVVSRAEPVSLGETGRLRDELTRRRLTPAVELRVGAGRPDGDVVLAPWRPGVAGCGALRAYAGDGPASLRSGPAVSDAVGVDTGRSDVAGPVRALLATPRLLFFAGKGGVGKSTCAAAAAIGMGGGPVRIYGADPAGSLGSVLGIEIGRGGTDVTAGVRAEQVDAAAALDEFRRLYLAEVEDMLPALGVGASATLDRRVLESLRELVPPGMDEIFAVASLAEVEGRVVIDSAPTGHFLRLLEIPDLGLGWLHALMRLVLRYGRGEALETTGGRLLSAARLMKRLRDVLRSEAGVVLVTLDEPIVRAETQRLHERLLKAEVPVVAWLVNRCRPEDEIPSGAIPAGKSPVIRAPEVVPAPEGTTALLKFFHGWRLA